MTVPQGYVTGELDPLSANNYLRRLGLSSDANLLLYTLKGARVAAGYKVTSPGGHVYVGGQSIIGANHLDWESFENYVNDTGKAKGWRIEESLGEEPAPETRVEVSSDAIQALMGAVQIEFNHAVGAGDYELASQVIQSYGKDAQQYLKPGEAEQFNDQISQLVTTMESYARETSVKKVSSTLSQAEISTISKVLDSSPNPSTIYLEYNDARNEVMFNVKFSKKRESPHTVDGRALYAALISLGVPEQDIGGLKKVLDGDIKTQARSEFDKALPFLKDVPKDQLPIFMEGLTFALGRTLGNKSFTDSFDLSLAAATYLKQYTEKNADFAEKEAATTTLDDFHKMVEQHKEQLTKVLQSEKNYSTTVNNVTEEFRRAQVVSHATNDAKKGKYFLDGLFQLFKAGGYGKREVQAFLDKHFIFQVDKYIDPKFGERPSAKSSNLSEGDVESLFENYAMVPRRASVPGLRSIYKDLVKKMPTKNTGLLSDIRHFLAPHGGNQRFATMMDGLNIELAMDQDKDAVYDVLATALTSSLPPGSRSMSSTIDSGLRKGLKSLVAEGRILGYDEGNLTEVAATLREGLSGNQLLEKHASALSSSASRAFVSYAITNLSSHLMSAFSSPEDKNYEIFSDFSSNFLDDIRPNAFLGTLESGQYRERVLSMLLPSVFTGVPYQMETGNLRWENTQARDLLIAAGYDGNDLESLNDKQVLSDVLLTHSLSGGKMSYTQQLRNSFVRTLGQLPNYVVDNGRGVPPKLFTKEEVADADISSVPYMTSEKNSSDTVRGYADKVLGSGNNNIIARLANITNQTLDEAKPQIDEVVSTFKTSLGNALSSVNSDVKDAVISHYTTMLQNGAESFTLPRPSGARFGQRFEFLGQIGPLLSHLETTPPMEGSFRRISPSEGSYFDDQVTTTRTGLYGIAGFSWKDRAGATHVFGNPDSQTGDAVDYSHTRISADYGTIEVVPYEVKMEQGLAYAHQAGVSTFFRQLGETMAFAKAQRGGSLPKVILREMRNINHTQEGDIDVSTVNQSTNPVLGSIFTGGFRTEGSRA